MCNPIMASSGGDHPLFLFGLGPASLHCAACCLTSFHGVICSKVRYFATEERFSGPTGEDTFDAGSHSLLLQRGSRDEKGLDCCINFGSGLRGGINW